ncbi:MAG: thiamine phosphate synthase [Chitinophagaceae bacterium]|nr:thiamine phosphate synthase [Chitinophagaceae bacterium]MDP1763552.1 thiamine phosphate synthase [Sediminibacterium sp.]MDP3667403.1 thiamine phosphate synthase [Sediminibacterium sp.]
MNLLKRVKKSINRMLFVVSNPTSVPGEAEIINALFDEGLEVFHLRKPGIAVTEINQLMERIQPEYHTRIALHQHHQLTKQYAIKRLHFTEMARTTTDEQTFIQLENAGYHLSTSVHKADEYKNISSCFAYTFFGPVFNSISKQGYHATLPDGFVFPVLANHPEVIAIGGIHAGNMQKVVQMNFRGIAVLGTIWQNPDKSIEQFKAVQTAWKQAGR